MYKLAMVSTIQFAASLQAAKAQLADQFPNILYNREKRRGIANEQDKRL
jgi:hypothetical protein